MFTPSVKPGGGLANGGADAQPAQAAATANALSDLLGGDILGSGGDAAAAPQPQVGLIGFCSEKISVCVGEVHRCH